MLFPRTALAAAVLSLAAPFASAQPAPSLVKIESKGILIRDSPLPGETRADDVMAGVATAVRASPRRWLILYATRSWRGVDDERSICYQLRDGAPDGAVLKEGFIARSINDWDPLNDGTKCVRQHGHGVVWGVPKGALIDGKPAENANCFVAQWRVLGVPYDPEKKAVLRDRGDLAAKTQAVEWTQFRLSDDESDIQILQPNRKLRQKGFETGPAFCGLPNVATMNQSFVPPVPFNAACNEWAGVNHFDGGRIAAIKFTYDPARKRYDWTHTGPLAGDADQGLGEASIARLDTQWAVAARVFKGKGRGVAWALVADPFKELPPLVRSAAPDTDAPFSAFNCADGQLRLFTGDYAASPRRRSRDPLYVWDVTATADNRPPLLDNRQVVFDSVKQGLKFRDAVWPRVDFAQLFPPHGKTQIVAYRVAPRAYNFPYDTRKDIPAIAPEEKPHCGLYYSLLTYANTLPTPWTFKD